MIKFPDKFFWGSAISAYQVEGNNSNCDWWAWEKAVGLKDVSAAACRHYELYREDFDLAKALNHNALRLSIEWSRIEPKQGIFSEKELNHYLEVIAALRQRNIEPVVTLHHFTNPLWLTELGGWQNKKATQYFIRYVEFVVHALSGLVRYWVTINEPQVYAYHSYLIGTWPPQEKSLLKTLKVEDNQAAAHVKAYRLIHKIYQKRNLKSPYVGLAHNLQAFLACKDSLKNKFAVYLRDRFYNQRFMRRMLASAALDYIGVNYYNRGLVDVRGWGIKNLLLDNCLDNHSKLQKNSLGWDIYPQGLYDLLIKLKKYNLPVFVLENGICTTDDALRWDFIQAHLKYLHLAISQGVDVLGYLYWSLIDNFEWDKGFTPRFGLIEVDYNTYKRTIRQSAKNYALICQTGRLESA